MDLLGKKRNVISTTQMVVYARNQKNLFGQWVKHRTRKLISILDKPGQLICYDEMMFIRILLVL